MKVVEKLSPRIAGKHSRNVLQSLNQKILS
jgi:hypothetical protein